MSVVWVLLVAATGAAPSDSNSQASTSQPAVPVAAAPVAAATSTAQPATRLAKELRQAIAEGLRRANGTKPADRAAAIDTLVGLFNELGQDRQLPAAERQRLGVEIRARLLRFAAQLRHEQHSSELARSSGRTPTGSEAGAAGGPEVEGLDTLVDLIQKTVGPQDWVLAQRIGGPGGAGQVAGGPAGQAGNNGAAGGGIDQQTQANGQTLVDLIQTTIAPDSWDIRGGPGTIMYYNPLRALVVRQTGDAQDNLTDLLNGLRK